MKKQGNMLETKEQDKTLETIKQICDLLDKEFKITVRKMLTEVRRTMYEQGRISTKRQT